MIGSSSARIEERLTDGVVIVVEVFREPLLGHGLLGELDISLRDVVVVMFVICERVVLGKGTKVLIGGSAQGATTSWKMKLTGRRKDKVTREKMVRKEKEVESSKREQ